MSVRLLLVASLLPFGLWACSAFDPESLTRRSELELPPPPPPPAETRDGDVGDVLDGGDEVSEASPVTPGEISFKLDIRPLLARSKDDPSGKGCKSCHYATEASHNGVDLGGLDMTTLRTLREGGGSSGKRIIVPGRPSESALIQKLKGQYPYGGRMPKNGPPYWSDADIKRVSDWIAQGAQGADDE
jgi:hypothetical protein